MSASSLSASSGQPSAGRPAVSPDGAAFGSQTGDGASAPTPEPPTALTATLARAVDAPPEQGGQAAAGLLRRPVAKASPTTTKSLPDCSKAGTTPATAKVTSAKRQRLTKVAEAAPAGFSLPGTGGVGFCRPAGGGPVASATGYAACYFQKGRETMAKAARPTPPTSHSPAPAGNVRVQEHKQPLLFARRKGQYDKLVHLNPVLVPKQHYGVTRHLAVVPP